MYFKFTGLGLSQEDMPQHTEPAIMKDKFTEIFLTKTRNEWTNIFSELDACVEPILEMEEVEDDPHNVAIETFISNAAGVTEPAPAPKLSRTPAVSVLPGRPEIGEHTEAMLEEYQFTNAEIKHLLDIGAVFQNSQTTSKL